MNPSTLGEPSLMGFLAYLYADPFVRITLGLIVGIVLVNLTKRIIRFL